MKAERKARKTVETYTEGVQGFLRWCENTRQPAELTSQRVEAYIADLLDAGAEAATALNRQSALKRFANWLVREGELDENTLAGLKPPKQDNKIVHSLTPDQIQAMIKACQGKSLRDRRDEAVLRLMLETGIRASESLGLRVEDVHLADGKAVIVRGKGGKGREVWFGPQTASALDRYLRLRRGHKLAATSPALWVGYRNDKPLTYAGLNKTLKDRAEAAGVPAFHLHLLRHTFAHRWLRATGSEQGLMAMAGWSNRAILDRYTASSAAERAGIEARKLNLGDF